MLHSAESMKPLSKHLTISIFFTSVSKGPKFRPQSTKGAEHFAEIQQKIDTSNDKLMFCLYILQCESLKTPIILTSVSIFYCMNFFRQRPNFSVDLARKVLPGVGDTVPHGSKIKKNSKSWRVV
jgi:hypothetical protein